MGGGAVLSPAPTPGMPAPQLSLCWACGMAPVLSISACSILEPVPGSPLPTSPRAQEDPKCPMQVWGGLWGLYHSAKAHQLEAKGHWASVGRTWVAQGQWAVRGKWFS